MVDEGESVSKEEEENESNSKVILKTSMENWSEKRWSISGKRSRISKDCSMKNSDLVKERERRSKMTEFYNLLQDLVPNVFSKAKDTREKIVCDTIDYIKHLERKIQKLENLNNLSKSSKAIAAGEEESEYRNWKSSVRVRMSGKLVFFAIQSWTRRSLAAEILMVFDKFGVEVLAANVMVVDEHQLLVSVTAVVQGGGGVVEDVKREIMDL